MVAMNPQTWDKDVGSIEPGGYLFYDSTKPMPPSKFRDDITVIGVPLTAITNREYTDPRQRQLFKNIIYLGALSALLDMDVAAIEKLIGEQFKGKDKLIAPNLHALKLGRDWALDEPELPARYPPAQVGQGRRPHLHRGKQRSRAGSCLWRRHRVRLVSDHALLLPRRSLHPPLRKAARRSRDQEEQIRHHPGRGRTRLDRHGHRRRLERRAGLHRHRRPRHLADAGVSRARLFRRNPVGHIQRAARRSFDRNADAHPAVRPHLLRLCFARRHQACDAVSRGSGGSVRVRRACLRPRGPAANARSSSCSISTSA